MVGIAGGSGSGKSTLAAEVARRFGEAVVLELDWYYRDLSGLSAAARDAANFDHPDAIDWELCLRQVEALADGRRVERPVYDFATHTRLPESRPAGPAGLVVVDGLLALHHERLRARWDLGVFVALDEERRFSRRLHRDTAERGRSSEAVRLQLAASVKPMHKRFVEPSRAHAHLIADGGGDPGVEAERVVAALEARLRGVREP